MRQEESGRAVISNLRGPRPYLLSLYRLMLPQPRAWADAHTCFNLVQNRKNRADEPRRGSW